MSLAQEERLPVDACCESMIACRADALLFLRNSSGLSLPDGATHEEIQRAYGLAAHKEYPANNPGDTKASRRFKFVEAAWAFLQAEKVIAERTESLRANPRSPLLFYQRAEAYFRTGNLDRAIKDCTEALRFDRTLFCAYAIRGTAWKRKGEYHKALADLNEALTWNATDPLALQSRGDTYRLLGKHDQAVTDCDQAIRLDPRFSWAYATRGAALREKKEYDRALADLNEALRLNPICGWANAERGEVHRLRGQIDEAIGDFDDALLLDMKNAWAMARRGEAYLSKGSLHRGLSDLTEAIRLDPNDQAACKAKAEVERILQAESEKKRTSGQSHVIQCPACQKKVRVLHEQLGTLVRCAHCCQPFTACHEEPAPQTSSADPSRRKLPTHSVDHHPDCKDCEGTMTGPDTARCNNCGLTWKLLPSGRLAPADPKRCEFCGTVMTVQEFDIRDSLVGVGCKNKTCGAYWFWASAGHWQTQTFPKRETSEGAADSSAAGQAETPQANEQQPQAQTQRYTRHSLCMHCYTVWNYRQPIPLGTQVECDECFETSIANEYVGNMQEAVFPIVGEIPALFKGVYSMFAGAKCPVCKRRGKLKCLGPELKRRQYYWCTACNRTFEAGFGYG